MAIGPILQGKTKSLRIGFKEARYLPGRRFAVAVARPEPWSVTLQVGQKTEVLHFASAQSWRQVTPQDLARTAHKVDEPSTEGRYEWVGDGADNAGTAPDRPSD